MKRAYGYGSSADAGADTSPQRLPKVSRRVKACTECQSRKIKCELPQGQAPCARCSRLGFQCTVNKSLQTLLEDDAEWKLVLDDRTRTLQTAVAELLRRLDLPSLDSFSVAGSTTTTASVRTPDPSIHLVTTPASSAGSAALATTTPTAARPDSSDGDGDDDSAAVVAPPMSSLLEVTKLRSAHDGHPRASPADLVAQQRVTLAEADELFQTFQISLNNYLWGGVALVHRDLAAVRASSPLLTAAILAVTALHMPGKEAVYDACYAGFLALVSDSMFARSHSLDDIRALCIGAFWLSEISWKLSGHAVRIAMEMNLHMTFSRAMRAAPDYMERARLWYLLYVCDHHFSIAFGRPPILQEDAAISCHGAFLQLPSITQADVRLHSQIGVFIILSRMQQAFGLDVGEPLTDEKLASLRQFNLDLDGWRIKWEARLAPNEYIGSYPAKGVLLHYHFAKLQLNALVYRGLREQQSPPASGASALQQEFGQMAIVSASNALNVILGEPDIRRSVVGVPLYLHTIITFSVGFLLKVHLKWSRFTPCVDPAVLMQLMERSIALLANAKASQRHLCFYIARGLEVMISRLKKWHETGTAEDDKPIAGTGGAQNIQPPQPDTNTSPSAAIHSSTHSGGPMATAAPPHPGAVAPGSAYPAYYPQGMQPAGMSQPDAFADLAGFYPFEDQYFPVEYFHSLGAQIPG